MRIYEVNFGHRKYGKRWSQESVSVKGYALDAIRRAVKMQNGTGKQLYVESVHLIAEGR